MDAVSIIIGIVVGTAIFKTPTLVFQNVNYEWQSYAVWFAGGLLSLCGALCYAELATSCARNGGEYIYLSKTYGSWLGFLFGWAQLTAVHSGTVGTMAYAFADYAMQVYAFPAWTNSWLAAGAIGVLTLFNLAGATTGRVVQNLLSLAKVIGLIVLIVAGFTAPLATVSDPVTTSNTIPKFGLALVFVLYAYGGWNDSVYVAAEVRNRAQNLPRALITGIAAITVLYLLVNFACLRTLGLEAARTTYTPAADVAATAFGPWGARATSLLIMICALGAINAMIFTGSRVYGAMSQDHRLFARLTNNRAGQRVPRVAVVAPGFFACLLILAVGTDKGQRAIDAGLGLIGIPAIPWAAYFGGFETLVAGTAPVFWLFFLLASISLFVLRRTPPETTDPFRVPLYPATPIVFCGVCVYMLYSSVAYAQWLSLLGFAPLLPGAAFFLLSARTADPHS